MLLDDAGGLPLLRFESFPTDLLVHGISTRHGGVSDGPYDSLNLSLLVPDQPERVRENCGRFSRALGFEPQRLVVSKQVHGDDALIVADEPPASVCSDPASFPRVDIQLTDRPGWLLSQRFADCVPILLAHPERRAIGVVHAGWRGTLKGALFTAIRLLNDRYAARPAGLRVGIGPSIGACCYEVGDEVASRFETDGRFAPSPGDLQPAVLRNGRSRPHLDLWTLNRRAALQAGVPPGQVEVASLCTRCHSNRFFSHRVLGFPAGRFGAAIGLLA